MLPSATRSSPGFILCKLFVGNQQQLWPHEGSDPGKSGKYISQPSSLTLWLVKYFCPITQWSQNLQINIIQYTHLGLATFLVQSSNMIQLIPVSESAGAECGHCWTKFSEKENSNGEYIINVEEEAPLFILCAFSGLSPTATTQG